MCTYVVFMWVHTHECKCLKRLEVSDLLELEDTDIYELMWMLGTKHRYFGGAANNLNH